jgi:hypothetical protein
MESRFFKKGCENKRGLLVKRKGSSGRERRQ